MKGLGPKQVAILTMLRKNKNVTATDVASIYGYETQAISALKGLEMRGYTRLKRKRWVPGPKFEEAFD